MRISKVNPVSPVSKVTNTKNRVATPVKTHSGYDTLAEWHREKTKSSASEAFRDADYATGLWKCQTEWDRTKEYLGGIAMMGFLLGGLYMLAVWFEGVVR